MLVQEAVMPPLESLGADQDIPETDRVARRAQESVVDPLVAMCSTLMSRQSQEAVRTEPSSNQREQIEEEFRQHRREIEQRQQRLYEEYVAHARQASSETAQQELRQHRMDVEQRYQRLYEERVARGRQPYDPRGREPSSETAQQVRLEGTQHPSNSLIMDVSCNQSML